MTNPIPIITQRIESPAALAVCRRQAAALAGLVGLSRSAHTRMVTAVAELSRAMLLACTGLSIAFALEERQDGRQTLSITFTGDRWPDTAASDTLEDAATAAGRLVDSAQMSNNSGQRTIRLYLVLPHPVGSEAIGQWAGQLGALSPADMLLPQLRVKPSADETDRLYRALCASGTGTWVWEPAIGRMVLDELALRVFGYVDEPFDGTVGMLLDRIHPDDIDRLTADLQTAAARHDLQSQFRILWSDGSVRHVALRGAGLGSTSGGTLTGVCNDVTEEEVRKHWGRQRGRQRLEAVGELAGAMAHEINNLLQPVVGMVDMVREDIDPSSPLQNDLAIVLDSARQAAAIIRDVLMFARQVNDTNERLGGAVRDLLDTALRFARPLLPPSVSLDCEIADGVEGEAKLNANDMRQILTNLATNAAHAMHGSGTIRITVRPLAVTLTSALLELPPGDYAEIAVIDTGCGIDPAIQPLIFEPFFSTKATGQGTGLGLSVVFGIVRGAGGDIAVESAPGKGATFRVYLPLCHSA